jgi:hypothetical protein
MPGSNSEVAVINQFSVGLVCRPGSYSSQKARKLSTVHLHRKPGKRAHQSCCPSRIQFKQCKRPSRTAKSQTSSRQLVLRTVCIFPHCSLPTATLFMLIHTMSQWIELDDRTSGVALQQRMLNKKIFTSATTNNSLTPPKCAKRWRQDNKTPMRLVWSQTSRVIRQLTL